MTRTLPRIRTLRVLKASMVVCLTSLAGASVTTAQEPGAASAAASSPIQLSSASQVDATLLGGSWGMAVLGLLVVLAAAAVLLRRRVASLTRIGGPIRSLTIVETTRLGERLRLSVIRYQGRELLVAHGDQTASLLVDRAVDEASKGTAAENSPKI